VKFSDIKFQEGATADCTDYDAAVGSTTCQMILDRNGITIAQFYAWNSAVNSDCSGLWLNYRYCVSITVPGSETTATASPTSTPTTPTPPGPTQSGQPSNCAKWDIANGELNNIEK
jgi:hypothetical protein